MNNSITEAQIFALCDSESRFPVDFEEAWRWIGYTRKNNAKRALLECGFIEELDLLIREQSLNHEGLSPQEKAVVVREESIFLTNECFKMWAMMAGTEKGRETRRYFLECERRLKTIAAKPDKKEIELTDLFENDVFASAVQAMSEVFKSLAKDKGMKRQIPEALNYADLAHAMHWVAHFTQRETQGEISDAGEDWTSDEFFDNHRWALMVRDAFATMHPTGAARWLMETAEKNPDSIYLLPLGSQAVMPGYRSGAQDAPILNPIDLII